MAPFTKLPNLKYLSQFNFHIKCVPDLFKRKDSAICTVYFATSRLNWVATINSCNTRQRVVRDSFGPVSLFTCLVTAGDIDVFIISVASFPSIVITK